MRSLSSWRDGWRRVFAAPAVIAGVFVITLFTAVPLAVTLRGQIEAHLGRSLMADQAADAVNWDWWQEFTSQASGLGIRHARPPRGQPRAALYFASS